MTEKDIKNKMEAARKSGIQRAIDIVEDYYWAYDCGTEFDRGAAAVTRDCLVDLCRKIGSDQYQ